ncbi:MAG: hypothetical protein ACRDYU_07970 [Actinomycetes bacterium]
MNDSNQQDATFPLSCEAASGSAALLAAARLVDELDAQRHREDLAFRDGYLLGWTAAYAVGYAHAEAVLDRDWARLAQPTAAELHRRRFPWLYGVES